MRQMPNLRYTARGRPHNLHRFSRRELNLGTLLAFAILDLLATAVGILVGGFQLLTRKSLAGSLSLLNAGA